MTRRPTAFITGASRGIGRSVALELAGCGFDIVGNATSYDPAKTGKGLAEVKARVEALGASFLAAPGDIASLESHGSLLSAALERFEKVDLLVNNAGIAPLRRLDLLEATPESFDRVLSVNLRGTFFLTQLFARRMVDQVRADPGADRPVIVFISSVSAEFSSPDRADYCLSKAALSHAALIFAHRLAEFGINVYEVRPGIISTDMTRCVKEKYDALLKDGLALQKRWGTPEDVARCVSALARGDFNYSTGLVVEVDGGLHLHRM